MAKSKSSDEELVNHYGGVRLSVTGVGNLRLKLYSKDEIKISPLISLPLNIQDNKSPTRISNFTQQKAKLEVRVSELNETFKINKMIVFVRPVAKSYPGQ